MFYKSVKLGSYVNRHLKKNLGTHIYFIISMYNYSLITLCKKINPFPSDNYTLRELNSALYD